MGQYKADRDIELLVDIARLADPAWELTVTGRGWPSVEGWKVDARFVTELEFQSSLSSASVVLVPYKRFYQSGVAIRALEAGTPVVGPRNSVLADIVGESSGWLADDDAGSWIEAIRSALSTGATDIRQVQESSIRRAVVGWDRFACRTRDL
ncbi:glycosyltransferase [Microbacterium sp. zg.B48]|uniref:glycosyltransferase n=1 Tax=Microbacterium sp. zg.B48 TaxID=2969408 RepID=UPI00214C8C57|nr:glycosyltransferase [Microbacterium sp. zg.B48]MCR2764233.1 glycosyltransferase [Microbacterium sp. zg.B48]